MTPATRSPGGQPCAGESPPPSHAPTGESWLASDRVQALANVLTVIVALTAIGLSIWQGYENRTHNRLSVVPNLESNEYGINRAFVDPLSGEYYPLLQNEDSLYAVSYSLKNTGLGPAVIQNLLAFRDNEKVFDAS